MGTTRAEPAVLHRQLLTWIDRQGQRQSLGTAAEIFGFSLSPDARRIAVSRRDPVSNRFEIWILDALRGTGPRLTSSSSNDHEPLWSPDGTAIAFFREPRSIYLKSLASGGEERRLVDVTQDGTPSSWSPDGRELFYDYNDPVLRGELMALSLANPSSPRRLSNSDAYERQPVVSPDGRRLAYVSDRSGQAEVWVERLPSSGEVWQVSTGGGWLPVWRADGRELFYLAASPGRVMAAPIAAGSTFESGTPVQLFRAPIEYSGFAATRDGSRFLVGLSENASAGSLMTILDWPARLRAAK